MKRKMIVKVQLPVDQHKAARTGEVWPDEKLEPDVLMYDKSKEFLFQGPHQEVWNLMMLAKSMKMFFHATVDGDTLQIEKAADWQDW